MNNELLILQYLLNKNGWISSNEIASIFQISVRTIRNIVKNINQKNDIVLSSPKGYCLSLAFRDYVRSYLIDNKNKRFDSDSTEKRQEYILKRLIIANNEISFYDLLESLFVSESTLNNDLSALKKHLDRYELILCRKKDQISIEGAENRIRKLMSDIIYNEVKDGLLNFNILNSVFPEYNVFSIRKIILQKIIAANLSIDDFGITDLVLHLCIMLDRLSANRLLKSNNSATVVDNTIYGQITWQLFRELETITGTVIDDSEIYAISPLIAINTKQILDKNTTLNDLSKFVDGNIIGFVESITVKVLHEYSINLNTDDFIIRFSLHLSQLLNTQKKSNRNPLLKNIKDSYPLVFEVSVYIADIIHKHYPALLLDEHEISYIALHVGMSIDKDSHEKCTAILIIPQYYNLKDYIINRLYQNFYNSLLIIDACNDESEIDYSQPFEIILSTQSLTVSSEAESIQITPFINDQDLKNIQQTIEMVNMKKKIKSNEPLFRLFNPACFEIFHNPDADKNQIIKILGHKLIDAHYVPASFIEDVIIRETLSSTAYSSLAVPHTLNTSGIKTCIGVGIFPNNYQWDHNSINIVLLLVIQEKDKELFKMLFQTLIRIFTSKEWLEAYRKISSYDDYMRFVKNLMIFK